MYFLSEKIKETGKLCAKKRFFFRRGLSWLFNIFSPNLSKTKPAGKIYDISLVD